MLNTNVLVVARRFWPYCDDACQRLLHQCAALVRAGIPTTVLTGRWHSNWPEYSLCRNVVIHRLLPGPTNNWNEGHFQKNVVQWISQRVNEYDCIYVDRSDGLLSAILSKLSKFDVPVISRYSISDSGIGITNGQKLSMLAMVDACRRCSKVVCPSASSHRWLVSHGISNDRIIRIDDPAWVTLDRTNEQKKMAAHALFECSSDFVVPGRSSIVLHLGAAELKPLRAALTAICDLLDQGALLRVWIVASGLPPNALFDLIKSRGWHREILIFDSFDDLEELLCVADLAIVSNPAETLQFSLPLIGHSGLPMIIADHPDCRVWLPESHHFQICESNEMGFSSKLQDWMSVRERWTSSADNLRQYLRRSQSRDACITQWISLFRNTRNEHCT